MHDEVKVSQADREAYLSMNTLLQKYRDNVMAGEWDSANAIHALARHRHQAERDTLARMEPVAWMYKRGEHRVVVPLSERASHMTEHGWTETPLFALPPAPEAGQ